MSDVLEVPVEVQVPPAQWEWRIYIPKQVEIPTDGNLLVAELFADNASMAEVRVKRSDMSGCRAIWYRIILGMYDPPKGRVMLMTWSNMIQRQIGHVEAVLPRCV